jgi:hypothetical protein
MGMHRMALRALALTLRDPVSAETYARTGGVVVPSKAVEACGMNEWGALFAAKGGPGILEREKSSEGKGQLVRMLLEVYMEDGYVYNPTSPSLGTYDCFAGSPSKPQDY